MRSSTASARQARAGLAAITVCAADGPGCNLLWRVSANVSGGGPYTLTHAYLGDPANQDAPNGDYHLAAGSPAIEASPSAGAPDQDADGAARPFNARWNPGATEWPGIHTCVARQCYNGCIGSP